MAETVTRAFLAFAACIVALVAAGSPPVGAARVQDDDVETRIVRVAGIQAEVASAFVDALRRAYSAAIELQNVDPTGACALSSAANSRDLCRSSTPRPPERRLQCSVTRAGFRHSHAYLDGVVYATVLAVGDRPSDFSSNP
jgi:hypothetical protein